MGEVVHFRRVESARPFTTSGMCFDDLWDVPPEMARALIDRGLVYLTEFACGDFGYGGLIIAASWRQACAIAQERGLGEIVIGRLDDAEAR